MNLIDVPIWMTASIRKEMIKRCGDKANLFFEGDDRKGNKQYLEVRMDGPYIDPCGTKDEISIYMEVNILINCTRDEKNVFNQQKFMGLATHMLKDNICIYKIGHKDFDESFYCELKLQQSDQIKNSYFGQIDPNVQVFQATTEAHYLAYPENA